MEPGGYITSVTGRGLGLLSEGRNLDCHSVAEVQVELLIIKTTLRIIVIMIIIMITLTVAQSPISYLCQSVNQ